MIARPGADRNLRRHMFGVKATMARRLPALMVLAAMAVACGLGGISRDQAIQLALGSAEGQVEVLSAESGRLDHFTNLRALPGERADRMVWAVVLSGAFGGECVLNSAGEEVCPAGAARKLVLLDYLDGELILTESR
jgi:hypothetical protein